MKEKIISITLIILLLGGICIPVWATSTSELNNQKKEIENKIDQAKDDQAEVKQELSAQMQEISKLDASISEVDSQITELTNQISALELSIKETEKKLEEKQKEFEKNKALMEERLAAMYERGETSFLDILFKSESLVEFISNYYMISEVTECDKELVESLEKEKQEIEDTKTKLENEKTELDSAKKEKQTKSSLLKNQKEEREEKANSLSQEEKKLQSDIDAYNKQVDKIEAQIQEAIRKAAEEAARKAAEAARSSSTGGSSSSGGNGLQFDGSFIWPCNNKIVTSTVKQRWGRMHKGIDIGARYENVYASASGYAYTLENPSGYGHYIIIVHGDGYISLYGHLNAFKVSYGQYVSQGQVIAQSGNSGSSTGAHLHFEIRKASSLSSYFSASPLNPLNYLPGGYTFAAGAQSPS